MKRIDKFRIFLISLIGFLVLLVSYVFYMGLFTDIELAEKNVSGIRSTNQYYFENPSSTSNFMDDFFTSLLIEEGIVTQRGIGKNNYINFNASGQNYENKHKANYQEFLSSSNEVQDFNVKTISNFDRLLSPKRIPCSNRFEISLEKARAYPSLKPYLEANNLPDTLRVLKIYDSSKRKTLYILSLDPLV